jgi:SAM-dependent methyltransferase
LRTSAARCDIAGVDRYDPISSWHAAADHYDDERRGDEEVAVAFLAGIARGGPALELAIGTGRIGLPLAATGVRVDGVDLSPAMVAKLRGKPGGDALAVTIGDFADVPVPGTYRLVYVVFNTLFNLPTQEQQVHCFERVARHLTDDGVFVVEAFVPAYLHLLRDGQYVDAEAIHPDEVRLDVGRHDPVAQLLDESHVSITADGIRLSPVVTRYAWPSELDLMARLAGLRLHDRWADWERRPFTSASRSHVSVFGW